MEHLRDSVRLRAIGQRDPLVEYKHEGAKLYRQLQEAIRSQVVSTIFKIGAVPSLERQAPQKIDFKKPEVTSGGRAASLHYAGDKVLGGVSSKPDIKKEPGRNDPCPCGSGKKYKKCHGG